MNFLLELREAAKHTSNELTRKLLKDAADRLSIALDKLHESPTASRMQIVNADWVRAVNVLATSRMYEPPGGSGGALREGAELQRAA